MAVYNSSMGAHDDDSDITIINPSIIHENNDEQAPIAEGLVKKENQCMKNDYVVVYHDPKEQAKQLEQILAFYIRDLKQETNTQLDCDKQLLTRIMDLIRPAYSTDQQKMIELDHTMQEIASLHDLRHVKQKEKIEKLNTEICQLNKMLLEAKTASSPYGENARQSILSISKERNSIGDYDQWTEIEDDAKKLHELVQSQQNQINEIVSLISDAAQLTSAEASASDNQNVSISNNTVNTPDTPTNNIMSSLLAKIQNLTGHHTEQTPMSKNTTSYNTLLENYSPGASPNQSLSTLTLLSLKPPVPINQTTDNEQRNNPIEEIPAVTVPVEQVDPPVPNNSNELKKCPICNELFPATINDEEMYDHIDKCLFSLNTNVQQTEYECPNCNRKMTGIDEGTYLQHLTDCYNRFI